MPILAEERGQLRKRSRAPLGLAVGLLALLLVGVALLPLTECNLAVGPVHLSCGRSPWDPWEVSLVSQRLDAPWNGTYVFRVGDWYWGLAWL